NWGWPRDPGGDRLPPGWLYDPAKLRRVGNGVRWREQDVETGAAGQYLKYREVFRCPEHYKNHRYQNDSRAITSYLMNGCVSAFTADLSFQVSRFIPDAVIFWEPPDPEGLGESGTGWYPEDWNDGSSTPDQGFSFRHGTNGATLGFIDGHVDWWSLGKYQQTLENPLKNPLWCAPDSQNGR
ncbi:MAG: hypothetical protein D6744_11260, partial [Planctomycetota bacterium]